MKATFYMIIFLFFLLEMAPHADADSYDNKISCEGEQGILVHSCSIAQASILLEAQPYESDFIVSYSMTCNRDYHGPKPSFLTVSTETGLPLTLQYNYQGHDITVGTGMGPLILRDTKPNMLMNLQSNSCELVFTKVESRPSARVQSEWAKMDAFYADIIREKNQKKIEMAHVISKLSSYAGSKRYSFCLIINIQKDQLMTGLLMDLMSEYETLYGRFDSSDFECPLVQADKLAVNIEACVKDPLDLSPFCLLYDRYKNLEDWYEKTLSIIQKYKNENNHYPSFLQNQIETLAAEAANEKAHFSSILTGQQIL